MNLNLEPRKIGWVLLAGFACSAIVWGLSVPLTGMREPFDSPTYYYVVAMFIAGILAALPAPRYWWIAVVGIFSGERIYMFVMMPENRGWLLFSIYMGLLTLTWLPSALGAVTVYIVNRVRTRRSRRGT
jgi:hypothetical protein